ncbi:MAG: NTP transferase domain-containing protein [Desulfobacterales bacterium]|nr:NTP transferase domain-containing protein [Desulfobacterales bacterium]
MKAVILAGGKGTRLAPYTTVFPKPLVPLDDRPIIDIIIRQLSYYGFRDITLTVGYLAELIQAYFFNMNGQLSDINLTYVKERKPTGTAGSLGLIDGLDETFLVMNGDVLTTLDYSKMVAYHREKGAILTIGMHRKRVKIDLGVIETDEDWSLTGYSEKPEKEYMVSMGVYIYEPEVLRHIDHGTYLNFPDLVLRLLDRGEKVVGYPCEDYWLDIGRHEDYALAQNDFERMKDKFLPGYIFPDK